MSSFRLLVFVSMVGIGSGLTGFSTNDAIAQVTDKAGSEKTGIAGIVKQIELSHKFRTGDLASFEKESSAANLNFLVARSRQKQLAAHLAANMETLKKHVEFVKSGEMIRDSHSVLSNEERLEVAKTAESILSKSDQQATNEARAAAVKKATEIDKERNAFSDSRYKEMKQMKAAADKEHVDFSAAFKRLVKEQGPDGLDDFALYEVAGMFSDSMVNFMYKNDKGKRLRLGISVRLESSNYVKPKPKTREQYFLLVDEKSQLVLSSGKLFISMKTEADMKQGDLWKFFKGVTDDEKMKQLVEQYK